MAQVFRVELFGLTLTVATHECETDGEPEPEGSHTVDLTHADIPPPAFGFGADWKNWPFGDEDE